MTYNFAKRIHASMVIASLDQIHHILNKAGLAAEFDGRDTFHIDADPHDVQKALKAIEDAGGMVAQNGKEYRVQLGGQAATIKEV